jgi:PAS domain S-box-containing protein
MLDLLDYPREHFIGKELWEIGVFPDKEQSKAAMRRLQREKSIRFENMPLKDKSGNEHPVEFVSNVYQEDHQPVIQCNIRDISERKRFENERAIYLTTEHSLRMEAETSGHAKDKFLAILSHELRTPLAPVVMTIHAIEADPDLPVKFREDLAMVRRNIDLEVKLIDDLLDLSRVTNGKRRPLRSGSAQTWNRFARSDTATVKPLSSISRGGAVSSSATFALGVGGAERSRTAL